MHQNERSEKHSLTRSFVKNIAATEGKVKLAGWIYHLRVLAKTTFIVIKDCTGVMQCVMPTDLNPDVHLRLDDCIEVEGIVKAEPRSKSGFELHISKITKLNETSAIFPFNS